MEVLVSNPDLFFVSPYRPNFHICVKLSSSFFRVDSRKFLRKCQRQEKHQTLGGEAFACSEQVKLNIDNVKRAYSVVLVATDKS